MDLTRYVTLLTNASRKTGGGIVFDSVEEDEYIETINKLGANVRCIDAAEGEFLPFAMQAVNIT